MTVPELAGAIDRAEAMVEEGVPGLALVVAQGDDEVFAGAWGTADRERGRFATPDTVFGLASISKLYTAAGVLRLAQRGALAFDDPATRWLPELTIAHAASIRVDHLLAHTSGLPPLPGRYHAFDRSQPGVYTGGAMDRESEALAGPRSERAGFHDELGFVRFLNDFPYEPLAAPGAVHNYSNEGYALVGAICARAAERPFVRHMEQSVLQPAELRRTAVGGAAAARLSDVARRYHRAAGELHPIPPWDAPAWYPASGVCASARDVVTLLRGLRAETVLFETRARCAASGEGYGYGINLTVRNGIDLRWHDGNQDGVDAAFAWAPEHDLYVVALANLDAAGCTPLALGAMAALLGIPAEPDERALAPPGDPAEAAGIYASLEGIRIELQARDGELGVWHGQTFTPARWVDVDRFLIGDVRARLLRRDGRVAALAADHRIVPRIEA